MLKKYNVQRIKTYRYINIICDLNNTFAESYHQWAQETLMMFLIPDKACEELPLLLIMKAAQRQQPTWYLNQGNSAEGE